jgi:type VII secretion effector (TIGR04197 family)
MPRFNVDTEQLDDASNWLKQHMQQLISEMQTAKSKIDALIADGYSTPAAQQKFEPYFDEYKNSVDKTLQGMEGISQYLQQVGTAFSDTDTHTASSLNN